MERFSMHQQRLVSHNVVIPDNIVGMMLLAALPTRWDHVSAIYLQGKTNITAVTSAGVRQAIVAEFDRTNSGDRQQAHKISAIKRKGEHPSWKGKAPANKSSTADDEPRPSSHKKKVRRSQKGKGKHAHVAERSPSPNPFTLAAPAILEPARPMIALQPSRAAPSSSSVASFHPSGVTYSTVASSSARRFTGFPSEPGPSTLREERDLLRKMNVRPTAEPLKKLSELKRHGEFMNNSPAVKAAVAASTSTVTASPQRSYEDQFPEPQAQMPNFGRKRKQVRKTLLQRMGLPTNHLVNTKGTRKGKSPLTPSIVEVSEEDSLFGDDDLDREIAESAGIEKRFSSQVGAIQIDDIGCGTIGVFDDAYDSRQVLTLALDRIHANDCAQQSNLYVAYSSKLRIGDVYNKLLSSKISSTVNCVSCEKDIEFIADSGASDHFTHSKSDFVTYAKFSGEIETANDKSTLRIEGYGTVFIKHTVELKGQLMEVTTKLQPVYYAPGMAYRLLSIGSLLQKGYRLYGDKRQMLIRKPNATTVMAFHPHAQDPNIYWLNAQIVKSKSALGALAMSAQGHKLWHQHLGHPSSDVLCQVHKHTTGSPGQLVISKELPICKGCTQGKMTSSSFPDSATRATEPFALIHSDLKQIPVISYHKYKYILTFFDDFTSHGWIAFLKDKASTYDAWMNFLAMVRTQQRKEVHAIMSDMGGEFTSHKLLDRFKELGIKVLNSVPHMPQQNGRAERFNRMLFEKAEAMRHFACLPKSWWKFCVEYAVYVYNRTPCQLLSYKSPYELLNKLRPDISSMRVLGCSAYVFLHEDQRQNSMSPHAELMTFIGFTDGIKGWKFMKSNNKIFYATKAVFNENTFLHCPNGSRASIPGIETGLLPFDEQNIPPEEENGDSNDHT